MSCCIKLERDGVFREQLKVIVAGTMVTGSVVGYRAEELPGMVTPGQILAPSNMLSQKQMFPRRSHPAVPACFLPPPPKRKQKGRVSRGPGCPPMGAKELENSLGRLLGEQTTKPSEFGLADLSPKLSVCTMFLENTNIGYVPSLRKERF